MKNDQFANIAASGICTDGKGLEQVHAPLVDAPVLPFESGIAPAVFTQKMITKEELNREVERQKSYYRVFMENYAPEMPAFRRRENLTVFDWRIGTEADKKEFSRVINGDGEWEQVKIPHFGAPLGKKTTFYRTEFQIRLEADEALFLHFDGVDYFANVYINGKCIGSHEGFFAPFEFDISECVTKGQNILVVEVENDFVQKRNQEQLAGEMIGGDKIYAATGPGYDDPEMGWHHCPPGMGIYQGVYLEVRARCFIQDIYVRPVPEENRAELWLEIFQCDPTYQDIIVEYSLYGRNFQQTVFDGREYRAYTSCEIGLGDAFTEAQLTAAGELDKPVKLYMEKGINYLKIPFEMTDVRIWSQFTPWLYEMQVLLKSTEGRALDGQTQQFGMRSFRMDTESVPKGTFYLNGEKIRLRGANTMGHEQQCVMRGDYEQLLTDLILAKVCNMNFLRLTQRPVQKEVYEYCDRIGLMTQTDLPLFGVLRKNKMAEAIRQAGEMEKLIRSHPCNILVSYINEPFPNAYNQPHRHLNRSELMDFFDCADKLVKLYNPDRVIKHVDGDYDPPSKTLPDNHCYTCWYNGCGVDAGALHKGEWLPVSRGWNYGCGEFGAEGLDEESVMRKYYPGKWLPQTNEEESGWSPAKIMGAQTGNFHYFFYDTQHSVKDWIEESQKHQAWATKWMTEAFRRDRRMVSFAIHLFIDAFPAGWMKAIMDVDRNPKQAYFAYRDALTPVMVSLRTDRYSCYEGEVIPVELWACNDIPKSTNGYHCYYEVLDEKKQVKVCGRIPVLVQESDSMCTGIIQVPTRDAGRNVTVRAALEDAGDKVVHTNEIVIQVYQKSLEKPERKLVLISCQGKAEQLAIETETIVEPLERADADSVIVVDDFHAYERNKSWIDELTKQGAVLLFLEMNPGVYQITERDVEIQLSSMLPMNYVSDATAHWLAEGFRKRAFWNWYDRKEDRITPILDSTVSADGLIPVLLSGNTDLEGNWGPAAAVGELAYGKGNVVICQLKLAGRTKENPAAERFFRNVLRYRKTK